MTCFKKGEKEDRHFLCSKIPQKFHPKMAEETALMKSAKLGQIHQVNNYISNYILLVKKHSGPCLHSY